MVRLPCIGLQEKVCVALTSHWMVGNVDVAYYLVENGGLVSVPDATGSHPIHLAAFRGHEKMVGFLVSNGSDIEIRNRKACTALHLASGSNATRAVDKLIDFGAEVEVEGEEGWRPLHEAASNGAAGALAVLLTRNADATALAEDDTSALHVAARSGSTPAVRLLLRAGANPNGLDSTGWTPLHDACANGHDASVLALIEAGALLESLTDSGSAPIHLAAGSGNPLSISVLLNAGATLDLFDGTGLNALHEAASRGHRSCVEALLDGGASPSGPDAKGWLPIHYAAGSGHAGCVEALLDVGAAASAPDSEGATPLHLGANSGHTAVIALLCQHGASIEAETCSGWRPMHEAAGNGFGEAVRLLASLGAQLDPVTGEADDADRPSGLTPFQLALWATQPSSAQALIDCGAQVTPSDTDRVRELAAAAAVAQAATGDLGDDLTEKGRSGPPSPPRASRWPAAMGLQAAAARDDTDALNHILGAAGPEQVVKLLSAIDSEGMSALHHAAASGAMGSLATLLAAGAQPGTPSSDGSTPLMLASAGGSVELVDALLLRGASVLTGDTAGWTAAHHAAHRGQSDILASLLKGEPTCVNATDSQGKTPLHTAVASNKIGSIRALLSAGASVSVRERGGWTPMHVAAASGHDDALRSLLEAGASPTERCDDGSTVIHLAASSGSLACVERLISSTLASGGETARLALVTSVDKHGSTPLHLACKNKSSACAKALLRAGAALDAMDNNGMTALHHAATNSDVALVKWLVEKGATVDGPKGHRGKGAPTPLSVAAGRGQAAVVRALIELNADPSLKDSKGQTAAHWAARGGNKDCLEVVLAGGKVSATVSDSSGRTPLHIASMEGHVDVATLLLSRGADAARSDSHAFNPLHHAAYGGSTAVTKILMAPRSNGGGGARPNSFSQDGATPIHMAALKGHTAVCRALLGVDEKGVAPTGTPVKPIRQLAKRTTHAGVTALELAIHFGHQECASLLSRVSGENEATSIQAAIQASTPKSPKKKSPRKGRKESDITVPLNPSVLDSNADAMSESGSVSSARGKKKVRRKIVPETSLTVPQVLDDVSEDSAIDVIAEEEAKPSPKKKKKKKVVVEEAGEDSGVDAIEQAKPSPKKKKKKKVKVVVEDVVEHHATPSKSPRRSSPRRSSPKKTTTTPSPHKRPPHPSPPRSRASPHADSRSSPQRTPIRPSSASRPTNKRLQAPRALSPPRSKSSPPTAVPRAAPQQHEGPSSGGVVSALEHEVRLMRVREARLEAEMAMELSKLRAEMVQMKDSTPKKPKSLRRKSSSTSPAGGARANVEGVKHRQSRDSRELSELRVRMEKERTERETLKKQLRVMEQRLERGGAAAGAGAEAASRVLREKAGRLENEVGELRRRLVEEHSARAELETSIRKLGDDVQGARAEGASRQLRTEEQLRAQLHEMSRAVGGEAEARRWLRSELEARDADLSRTRRELSAAAAAAKAAAEKAVAMARSTHPIESQSSDMLMQTAPSAQTSAPSTPPRAPGSAPQQRRKAGRRLVLGASPAPYAPPRPAWATTPSGPKPSSATIEAVQTAAEAEEGWSDSLLGVMWPAPDDVLPSQVRSEPDGGIDGANASAAAAIAAVGGQELSGGKRVPVPLLEASAAWFGRYYGALMKSHPENRPQLLEVLARNEEAVSTRNRGKLMRAVEMLEDVILRLQAMLGDSHPAVLYALGQEVVACNVYGMEYISASQWNAAMTLLKKAELLTKPAAFPLPERKALQASTMDNLGNYYYRRGKFRAALQYIQKASALIPNHQAPPTAADGAHAPRPFLVNKLRQAAVLSRLDRHPEALQLCLEAAPLLESDARPHMRGSAAGSGRRLRAAAALAWHNAAVERVYMGRLGEALEGGERAVVLAGDHVPPTHPWGRAFRETLHAAAMLQGGAKDEEGVAIRSNRPDVVLHALFPASRHPMGVMWASRLALAVSASMSDD